jgi:rhamnosyltransferase
VPKPGSTVERHYALNALYGDERLVKEPVTRDKLGYRYYLFSDANSAIRADVWQTTRFPEELKVFEDIGIAKRILDGGKKIVYEPKACVYHSHNHTTSELFKRYFDLGVTFRRLEIWNAQMRASLLHEVLRIVSRKLARSGGNGTSQKPGASVHQDFAKSVGLLLGLNEHRLPLAFKRHLSAYRVFE